MGGNASKCSMPNNLKKNCSMYFSMIFLKYPLFGFLASFQRGENANKLKIIHPIHSVYKTFDECMYIIWWMNVYYAQTFDVSDIKPLN